MNSYRKHYLSHISKKTKKVHKKQTTQYSSKKYFKYYLVLFFLLPTLPLLYTDTTHNESLLVQWVKKDPNLKNGLTQKQNQDEFYNYPEIKISGKTINEKKESLALELYNGEEYITDSIPQNPNSTTLNNPNDTDGIDFNLPNNFPIAEPLPPNVTYSKAANQFAKLDAIENSEYADSYVQLEDIGDLVDENNQDLGIKNPNPYQEVHPKEKAFDFHLHKISSGESLWAIARKYHVNLDSIISLNQIKSPHLLKFNQIIKIPQLPGVYHKVRKNDSLYAISKKYNISLNEIKEYNTVDGYLNPGDLVFLYKTDLPQNERDFIFGNIFVSPATGSITSRYGVRIHPIKKRKIMHTGIDIGKNYLEKVKAAAEGVVIKATYFGSYGNFVTIKHSNGYETSYAHLHDIWVKVKQRVKKGQYIGRVGNTGLSTGPHLHFEVKHQNKFVNPIRFIKF